MPYVSRNGSSWFPRRIGAQEKYLHALWEWGKSLPDSAWKPLPLPEDTRERFCVVKTLTGRVLAGNFHTFNAHGIEAISNLVRYQGVVGWVEAGD